MGRNADRSRLEVLGTVRNKESSDGQSPGRVGKEQGNWEALTWCGLPPSSLWHPFFNRPTTPPTTTTTHTHFICDFLICFDVKKP